ncbi:MAG: class I SAM-dependent methyltransferase [Planctomycetota bacterium]
MPHDGPVHRIEYDLLVNWTKRLAREGPFFLDLFRARGVRRVLDLACGTGRHAALFSDAGIEVVALDASDDMIHRARENFGALPIRFVTADMRQVASLFEKAGFDACVCLGNALPCVDNPDQAARLIDDVADLLRPGGVFVIHMLNFNRWTADRRIEGPRLADHPDRTVLFLKVFEPAGARLRVSILQLEKRADWELTADKGDLTVIPPDAVLEAVRRARLPVAGAYEDHTKTPFKAVSSDNLILVAEKPAT